MTAHRRRTGPRGVPGLIVVKRLIMQGFIVMDFMDQRDEALADLQSWVASGKLKVQEDVINGLENTPKALIGLLGRREPRQADGEGVIREPGVASLDARHPVRRRQLVGLKNFGQRCGRKQLLLKHQFVDALAGRMGFDRDGVAAA